MKNMKMTISYDGSKYYGWQRLTKNDLTIQGKLEGVISQMAGSKIEIIGSGRTDAGVHAKGQIANFHINCSLSIKEMHHYINHYLPKDIVVTEILEVDDRFHSRYHAIGKKYVYYVWNHWTHSPFHRKYSHHIAETLDIELMLKAAKKLIGTHDFLGFSSLKKTKKTTIRTINEINIEKEDQLLTFTFIGDGFLYNMIRIIMGSIIDVGLHKKKSSHIDEVFQGKTRSHAGITFPPQGLFLEKVYY